MAKKKKKKMTPSQAAAARWEDSEDYVDDFEMESEARFWWRKMGRRGRIRLIAVVIIIAFGFWVILGMPGVVVFPLFG